MRPEGENKECWWNPVEMWKLQPRSCTCASSLIPLTQKGKLQVSQTPASVLYLMRAGNWTFLWSITLAGGFQKSAANLDTHPISSIQILKCNHFDAKKVGAGSSSIGQTVWCHCKFFFFFLYILKQVPIYFSRMWECWNMFFCESPERFCWIWNLNWLPSARGWADNDWISICGWRLPYQIPAFLLKWS